MEVVHNNRNVSHRKHMNHSKEFWAEVERYCPEYKACRKRLKEYALV
ncbi:MAG: M48 family metallopeptidase [Lachnospiraceae bacterium]